MWEVHNAYLPNGNIIQWQGCVKWAIRNSHTRFFARPALGFSKVVAIELLHAPVARRKLKAAVWICRQQGWFHGSIAFALGAGATAS